ncbi:unnamed protein product [Clonostachys rosea f. rosea IK726]|uniref:Uncharacterized protein n=2 Tax=Bionectria ochroleuca TaxID=29856 RepID=A0A0B7JVG1_BIOOC|nr:unnamed protein product [Clonostachys rosea f. rosea IK726]
MNPSQIYQVQISSSGYDFRDTVIAIADKNSTSQNLLIQSPAALTSKEHVQVRQGLNPYTIVISQSPTDFLILEGPSGKGEYQLRATSDTIPFGIGGGNLLHGLAGRKSGGITKPPSSLSGRRR